MKNINSIIASHIKFILLSKAKEYGCNCKNKESYPLQNQCLTPKVICKATMVTNSDDKKRVYFGASDTPFKLECVGFAGGREIKIFITVFQDLGKKYGWETVFPTLDGAGNYWKK